MIDVMITNYLNNYKKYCDSYLIIRNQKKLHHFRNGVFQVEKNELFTFSNQL